MQVGRPPRRSSCLYRAGPVKVDCSRPYPDEFSLSPGMETCLGPLPVFDHPQGELFFPDVWLEFPLLHLAVLVPARHLQEEPGSIISPHPTPVTDCSSVSPSSPLRAEQTPRSASRLTPCAPAQTILGTSMGPHVLLQCLSCAGEP